MDINRLMYKALQRTRSHDRMKSGFIAVLVAILAIMSAEAAVDRTDAKESGAGLIATAAIEVGEGVEHIRLDLSEAVGYVAQRDGDELILWFDQPRQFDLSSLVDPAGRHLKGARVPIPGPSRWLVFDLAPGSDVLAEHLQGHQLIITLSSKAGAPTAAERKEEPYMHEAPKRPQMPLSDEPARGPSTSDRIKTLEGVADDSNPDGPIKAQPSVDDKGDQRLGPRPLVPMARPAAVDTAKAPYAVMSSASQGRREALRHQVASTSSAAKTGSQPGQFQVDETALDRALERTLTREGAVLMPFGMIELEPSLSYTRRELDTPALINLFGFPGFGEANITRNDYTAALALRAGLPFDAQLEVDAPFTYVDQSEMMAIGFDPGNDGRRRCWRFWGSGRRTCKNDHEGGCLAPRHCRTHSLGLPDRQERRK